MIKQLNKLGDRGKLWDRDTQTRQPSLLITNYNHGPGSYIASSTNDFIPCSASGSKENYDLYIIHTSPAMTSEPMIMQMMTGIVLCFANSTRPTRMLFCERICFHSRPARDAEKLKIERQSVTRSQDLLSQAYVKLKAP